MAPRSRTLRLGVSWLAGPLEVFSGFGFSCFLFFEGGVLGFRVSGFSVFWDLFIFSAGGL